MTKKQRSFFTRLLSSELTPINLEYRADRVSVALAVVLAGLLAATSMNGSLWLDELHSTWCATGTWTDVSERATIGNQLSPYFRLLWLTGKNFGETEAWWRVPSLLAWLASIATAGYWLAKHAPNRGVCVLGLIVFDRAQAFYATEARPYALMSLFVLWSWLALARWSEIWFFPSNPRLENGARRWRSLAWWSTWPMGWTIWCGLNGIAFWLQPIALLCVASQFVYLSAICVAASRFSSLKDLGIRGLPIALAALVILAITAPAFASLVPVWEHRQQWAAFASDYSVARIAQLLPFAALLVPIILGMTLGMIMFRWSRSPRVVSSLQDNELQPQNNESQNNESHTEDALSNNRPVNNRRFDRRQRAQWLWLCAWSLPCLCVVALTASGVAPLMHRRYVIAASIPLVLWYACSWVEWSTRVRGWVLVASIVVLLHYQNSLVDAARGRWSVALRGEDWRGAIAWVQQRVDHDRPLTVYCASNLIEGARSVPAQGLVGEYLTLPLRSIYRVGPSPSRSETGEAPKSIPQLVPLANDPRRWPATIRATRMADDGLSQFNRQEWLLVRCSSVALARSLRNNGLQAGKQADFGGVQVLGELGFKEIR